jgi:hypothetical protein
MGWLRSKLFHPTHHRCLPQIFIHDPTVHALQKHSKNIKKTKKCLYSNGKMIINIDQPWDLDGFWGSYFQTNQFFKVKAHKPKAPQPCFSLAQSSIFLQYHFWAACWQRDSHPKETHGENWPKACKTKSFFQGKTCERTNIWISWFLMISDWVHPCWC